MEEYLTMIPQDIVRDIIIPMTYCRQPVELLEDISSYYLTMTRVKALYKRKWPSLVLLDNADSYLAWLSNDICRFLNDDRPMCEGIIHSYKNVFRRLYMNRNKEVSVVDIPDVLCDDYHDIKMSIGLLSVNERQKLETFLGV